jgi:hypothetical protein
MFKYLMALHSIHMIRLNQRTEASPYRVGRAQESKPRKARLEYVPPYAVPKHKGPKVFLNYRNPLRAKFYYIKGARGRCKIGAERSAHGIRWNYYMRTRKNIIRIAPKVFSGGIPICSGIMKDMKAEKQRQYRASGFVRAEWKKGESKKERDVQKSVHEKGSVLRLSGRRSETGNRSQDHLNKVQGSLERNAVHVGTGNLAKIIPIKIHPRFLGSPNRSKAKDAARISRRGDVKTKKLESHKPVRQKNPVQKENAAAKTRIQRAKSGKIRTRDRKPDSNKQTLKTAAVQRKSRSRWAGAKTHVVKRGNTSRQAEPDNKSSRQRKKQRGQKRLSLVKIKSSQPKPQKEEGNLFYICGQKKNRASPLRVAQADAQPPHQ